MNQQEYQQYDAIGLADLIRRKEVSSDEVLAAALQRLDEVNPKLNLLAHDLRVQAEQWRPSENVAAQPLAGVPFLLKDLLADWQGTPMWSGSNAMRHYISMYNSDLVDVYEAAGLRIFGKTTTPEWGLLPYTETKLHGLTRNPWHTDYTTGGSSGGSAAAVAVRVVPMAHGGDGGGSIRIPAHHCGIFGLKPSRGRISSMTPMLEESWQGMVVEHVLTRSVRDSALMLDIAAQTQPRSLYACPKAPAGGFLAALNEAPKKYKIAVCAKPYLGGEIDAATRQSLEHAQALLADLGHELIEASPQFASAETLGRAMLVLIAGETAKICRGYQATFGKEITWRDVEPATWALMAMGRQLRADEAFWARDIMLHQAQASTQFFREYDALLTPVCPRTTPKVGELAPSEQDEKMSRLLLGRLNLGKWLSRNPLIERQSLQALQYIGFTAPFNMTGNPAMSVPLFMNNGLPIGSQLVAAHGNEALLLALAAQLEIANDWCSKKPPI